MRVALSVDALAPSLTGIGRYTWELVQGMQRQAEISQLGYYRHGRAVANPATNAGVYAKVGAQHE